MLPSDPMNPVTLVKTFIRWMRSPECQPSVEIIWRIRSRNFVLRYQRPWRFSLSMRRRRTT
jgi:hypothetical protein